MIRRILLQTVTRPPILPVVEALAGGPATILMLHRFADPEVGNAGHAPEGLAAHLAWLRRRHYHLAPLADLFRCLTSGEPLPARTVVFTVDDGYADFAKVGASVFAEYDCPVTVFAITGFLDGRCWNWWDKATWALESSPRDGLTLEVGNGEWSFRWGNSAERAQAAREIVERMKRIPERDKLELIGRMATALEIELPARAPARMAPMTWDEARACARRGVTYGPHTVTHPILAQADAQTSDGEIEESWWRLQQESDAAIPIFCYPNGDPGSFGPREIATLARLGLVGAVSSVPDYVARKRSRPVTDIYSVPRFTYPEDQTTLVQIVSGFERGKGLVRRALGIN